MITIRWLIALFICCCEFTAISVLVPRRESPRFLLNGNLLADKYFELKQARAKWDSRPFSHYRMEMMPNEHSIVALGDCIYDFEVKNDKIAAVEKQSCTSGRFFPALQTVTELMDKLASDLQSTRWINGSGCQFLLPEVVYDEQWGYPTKVFYRMVDFQPDVVGWGAYFQRLPHLAVEVYHSTGFTQRGCGALTIVYGQSYDVRIEPLP
ncbi:MAG: hypothetical protein KF726_11555 [Anaerolineae bacterium]|nr:hypothetical protein [Anaerolineae bacterium]